MRNFAAAGIALALTLPTAPLSAQEGAWDSPRVLALIEAARARRAQPYEDSALVNYRANAGGWIYFYLDREDTDERTLVKVDQVALEVFWAYPGSTRQRIVGLRDESLLPNRMRYHLDHLTVVQNEFGDRINLGDGDEVQSVLHPVAPAAEVIYHYRLVDSLSIRLGGLPEPLRVYRLEVRPRDPAMPGIVGSLFLDAENADIVRMDFTFTRASYVDRRLDYIRISLENGLWQGRFWLPFEQRVELRRQVAQLDFPAGAIIRGHMRVRDYEFNLPLPPNTFRGPTVTAVPPSARERFAFEEPLFAELAEEGLAPDADLEALREEAIGMVGRRFLDGLPRLRLNVDGASSVLRYNRVEGLHLGAGLSYRPSLNLETRLGAGYSFGREEPSVRLGARLDWLDRRWEADAWYRRPRDLGYPSIAGAMNTLSSLAAAAGAEFGHDFLDLSFSDGFRLGQAASIERFPGWRWSADASASRERDMGAPGTPGDELDRAVITVEGGGFLETGLTLERSPATGLARSWTAAMRVEGGFFDPDGGPGVEGDAFGRAQIDLGAQRSSADQDWRFLGRLRGGVLLGEPPVQRHFLLGGRATVPGYAFRGWAGDRSALLQLEARRRVVGPWVTARASGAVGWTDLANEDALTAWPWARTGTVGPSVGAGVGLVGEILWLDLWRGLDDGEWELLVSVDPRLWDFL